MIKISGNFTPATINKKVDDINRAIRQQDTPLKFPSTSKYVQISGDAAIIQLFLHWAKLSKSKRVFTSFRNSEKEKIKDMLRTPWGLAISLIGNRFVARDETSNLTEKIERYRKEILSSTDNRFKMSRIMKGPVFTFFCADHLNFFSDSLYVNEDNIRDKKGYIRLVLRLLSEYVPSKKISAENVENIAIILRELIENTGDHGLHDIEFIEQTTVVKRRLDRSVRGLVTRKINFRNISFGKEADGAPALITYFLNIKGETPKRTALYLSVFDSGAGYAANFLKRPLSDVSFEEELAATKKCFIKNATTKKGIGYGQGLALALSSLQLLGGLLILRTGRVLLHINPEYYQASDPNSIERCISWHAGGQIHEQSAISGTAITIIIPL